MLQQFWVDNALSSMQLRNCVKHGFAPAHHELGPDEVINSFVLKTQYNALLSCIINIGLIAKLEVYFLPGSLAFIKEWTEISD